MKILNLTYQSKVYTSNVYLLTGEWNTLKDLNTLIDVGRDSTIFEKIDNAATGVGKQKIAQIVLTHSHYDHASLLSELKNKYSPKIYANSQSLEHVDVILKGGESIKIADRQFEVIHIPCHSNDSICLYCEEERVLFSGDTPLIILDKNSIYDYVYIKALEYITTLKIESIYFGHGEPLKTNCRKVLLNSLKNVSKNKKGG